VTARVIVPVRARQNETVEIIWTLVNGRVYHQRVTTPPEAVLLTRGSAEDCGCDPGSDYKCARHVHLTGAQP